MSYAAVPPATVAPAIPVSIKPYLSGLGSIILHHFAVTFFSFQGNRLFL